MKVAITHIFPLILLFVADVQAQICGTRFLPSEHKGQHVSDEYIQNYLIQKSLSTDTLAVSIHIIETPGGGPGIDFETILDELVTVNNSFSESGLYFIPCGAERYIDGEVSYSFNTADQLNQQYHVENTINIYYTDFVTDNISIPLCGFAVFPWSGPPSKRYIMMAKGCSDNGATLAHEFGHFFGLLHTHEVALGQEYADGTNCEATGDLICDTPADPTLGAYNVSGCSYVGNEIDPQGDRYAPNPKNIMSYAPSRCRRIFSSEQSAIIRFFYESNNAQLINNCDFYPDFAVRLTQTPITIQSGELLELEAEIQSFGLHEKREVPVYFWLSDEAGKKGQIIKRDTVSVDEFQETYVIDFTLEFPLNKNSGTYYISIELDPEQLIYERSESNNLSTLIIEVDNSRFMDAVLYPNPAQNYIRVFLREKRLLKDIYITVRNRAGMLVKTVQSYKKEEEFFVEIDISELPEDYYFIELYFVSHDENRSFPFIKIQ